jgi:Competence protein CoiA-like family
MRSQHARRVTKRVTGGRNRSSWSCKDSHASARSLCQRFRHCSAYPPGIAGHGEELARFAGGQDTRQLYARDVRLPDEAALVYLPEGEADAFRQDCRAGHLVCPLPDCPDRRYIARGGSRRHHFAHHGGAGGHAPERYFHLVGKRLIADLVRDRHPGAEVVVEGRVENGQVADVLARSPGSGRRYAFELQYSPLTVEEWRARHEGYCSLDIVDIWLFGHTKPHFCPVGGTGLIVVSLLLEAVFRADVPVLFLNPDERTFGTALLRSQLAACADAGKLPYGVTVGAPPVRARVAVEPLSLTDVDGLGVQTAALRRLREANARMTPARRQRFERQLAEDLTRPEPRVTLSPEERDRRLEAELEALRRREAEDARAEAERRRSVLADLKAQGDAGDRMAALRHKRLQEYFARDR